MCPAVRLSGRILSKIGFQFAAAYVQVDARDAAKSIGTIVVVRSQVVLATQIRRESTSECVALQQCLAIYA